MTRSFSRWLPSAAAMLVAFGATAAMGAPVYKIEAVPAAGSYTPTSAQVINSKGWVMGSASTAHNQSSACYVFANGVTKLLPGSEFAYCHGLNDLGDVVGEVDTQAYVWPHDGSPRQPLAGMRYAMSINNLGQIVGGALFDGTNLHAAFYDNGTLTDMGTLGGTTSLALKINASGWATGRAEISPTDAERAFRWKPGKSMKELDHLAGWDSGGQDINDRGHVLGDTVNEKSTLVAFIDKGHGQPIEIVPSIDGLDMSAAAINGSDEVLANIWNWDETSSPSLTRNGKTFWLKKLLDGSRAGWTSLGTATDINDAGQISGGGKYQGELRAYIATPVTTAP